MCWPLMGRREAHHLLITGCIMMQMHKGAELTLPFPDFGEPERDHLRNRPLAPCPLPCRTVSQGPLRGVRPLLRLPGYVSGSHGLRGAGPAMPAPLGRAAGWGDSPLRLPAASSARCDSFPGFVLLTLDVFLADVTSL